MLFFYRDEGNAVTGWNAYNQLVLIYHLDNGKVPGGWYTYLATNNDMVISFVEQEDGSVKKVATMDTGKPLSDDDVYYSNDADMAWNPDYHGSFEYEGVKHVGHQTIEECVEAYMQNALRVNKVYDHLCISSELLDNATLKAMVK